MTSPLTITAIRAPSGAANRKKNQMKIATVATETPSM
jgi:hypothetical protein